MFSGLRRLLICFVCQGHRYSAQCRGREECSDRALLVRLQGASIPDKAAATLHTISAGLNDAASLGHPDAIAALSPTLRYAKDLTIDLDPYTVAVAEIRAE